MLGLRQRSIRWGGGIALTIALALAASSCGGGGGEAREQVPFPETTPFSEALQSRIHELRDEASAVRHLPVNEKTKEGTLTRQELGAYYEATSQLTEEEERELRAFNTAFRLLGLIEADDDLLDSFRDFYSAGTLGLYLLDEDALVLIDPSVELTPDQEMTIVHEYVHSFQTAFFDFDRFDRLAEREEREDYARSEYGITADCLIEGDAVVAEIVWAIANFGPEWQEIVYGGADEQSPEEPELPSSVPDAIRRYAFFSYNECVDFVADIWGNDGWNGVNRIYNRLPLTTEQVLHPDKYRSNERPTSMAPVPIEKRLGKGWKRALGALFGEFDVYNYLYTVLANEAGARQAAAGWGVSWLSIYETDAKKDEQDVVVHISFEWDTTQDFREFSYVHSLAIAEVAGDPLRVPGTTETAPLCWEYEDGRGYGFFSWDEDFKRNDLVIATTKEALDLAISGGLSTSRIYSCDW